MTNEEQREEELVKQFFKRDNIGEYILANGETLEEIPEVTEALKAILLAAREAERRETVAKVREIIPNALHEYHRQMLEVPDLGPVERKALKQAITNDFLATLEEK